MKRIHGAVVGAVAMALSGAAFAQGMDAEAGKTAGAASVDLSTSYKASEIQGMAVQNKEKEKLGSVSDLIIGQDGKVSGIVLHEGGVVGLGGNQYLVPWDRVQLAPGSDMASIDVSKESLASEFAAVEEKKSGTAEKSEKSKSREDGKPTATSPPASTR